MPCKYKKKLFSERGISNLRLPLQVASVNHYEPRGGLAHGDGLKATHVLPFVTNFALMLEQLEGFQDMPDPNEEGSEDGRSLFCAA